MNSFEYNLNSEIQYFDKIRIGKEKWIPLTDIFSLKEPGVDIDPIIRRLMDMWKALETHCVAECCGLTAFEFWPEDIRKAKASLNSEKVIQDIASVKLELETLSANVFNSEYLSLNIHKNEFVKFLEHLIESFKQP